MIVAFDHLTTLLLSLSLSLSLSLLYLSLSAFNGIISSSSAILLIKDVSSISGNRFLHDLFPL